MLHFLLLAIQALPAYAPYREKIVSIDYEDGRLVVGTHRDYVAKITDEARWKEFQAADFRIGKHSVTSWRADADNKGLYFTHNTNGKSWRTYLPAINNLSAITAAALDSLVDMHNEIGSRSGNSLDDILPSSSRRIENRSGVQSGNLLSFIVLPEVSVFLQKQKPSEQEFLTVLPQLRQTINALEETGKLLLFLQLREGGEVFRKKIEDLNKIDETLEQFTSQIFGILTKQVAVALTPSNPAAVKTLTEFLLSSHHYKIQDGLAQELAKKIGQVTDLNLSQAHIDQLKKLLQFPKLVGLMTSPSTLKTIESIDTLQEMAAYIESTPLDSFIDFVFKSDIYEDLLRKTYLQQALNENRNKLALLRNEWVEIF